MMLTRKMDVGSGIKTWWSKLLLAFKQRMRFGVFLKYFFVIKSRLHATKNPL